MLLIRSVSMLSGTTLAKLSLWFAEGIWLSMLAACWRGDTSSVSPLSRVKIDLRLESSVAAKVREWRREGRDWFLGEIMLSDSCRERGAA